MERQFFGDTLAKNFEGVVANMINSDLSPDEDVEIFATGLLTDPTTYEHTRHAGLIMIYTYSLVHYVTEATNQLDSGVLIDDSELIDPGTP